MKSDEVTGNRSTTSAMLGILISRFFGFLREMVIANFFGLSPQVDAFYAAYRIPNFFRTLLGEGSLSAAFIPVLSRSRVSGGRVSSVHLTQAFFGIILVISGAITLLGITFSSQIISVVAPGFSPDVHDLAARIMKITFPFFAFLAMGAWAMGILHTSGRFFLPAVAPVCLSGSQILSLLILGVNFAPDPIYALAWGVLVGGALQFAVQVPALAREGFLIRPVWDPRLEEIKKIGTLFVPVVIALGVNQVNSLVDMFLSSFLEQGSLAALSYATRLYTFPLSLFSVSVVMVALPSLSRSTAEREESGTGHSAEVSGWWLRTLFFLIPSAVFLLLFSEEVVSLVFERGAFGSMEVERVGGVLMFYAIGLPAFGTVKILASGFHSLQDTRTPMIKAVITTLINIALSVFLMQFIGVMGIALATSLSACLHVVLLSSSLTRVSGESVFSRSVVKIIILMLTGSALMAIAGICLWRYVLIDAGGISFLFRLLRILVLMLVMAGTYLLATRLTGVGGLRMGGRKGDV
jgi:putative peptidoglycan lipid II flippase